VIVLIINKMATGDFDFHILSSTVNDIKKQFWLMERKDEKFEEKVKH